MSQDDVLQGDLQRRNQQEMQLQYRAGQKNFEKEMKNMDRSEWNQLFDYNTNKEIQNQQDYQSRFAKINQDMQRKGSNYYNNVVGSQQQVEGRKQAIQPGDGTKWTHNMNSIQDNLANQRKHQQRAQNNENMSQLDMHQRDKQFQQGERQQQLQNRLIKENQNQQRLMQAQMDKKNEQAAYQRDLQMQQRQRRNHDSPQMLSKKAMESIKFESNSAAMIPGINNPQTIGSSPFIGGGQLRGKMIDRNQAYADGGAGSASGSVNQKGSWLPSMSNEARGTNPGQPVNKSLQISPSRYNTLSDAGANVLLGGGSYNQKNTNLMQKDNQRQNANYASLGRLQMASPQKRSSNLSPSLNLGNARSDQLQDAMQYRGSKLTGGADPSLGHNPLTNPVPRQQQNPYINKMGMQGGDYGLGQNGNSTRNRVKQDSMNNYSFPETKNRSGNGRERASMGSDIKRAPVSALDNGGIVIHQSQVGGGSMLQNYQQQMKSRPQQQQPQQHNRLNSMPSSPILDSGTAAYLSNASQNQAPSGNSPARFGKNVNTAKRYHSNIPFD